VKLRFRTITIVEGPEVDAWLERQDALELAEAAAARADIRWRAVYQLLGGTLPNERKGELEEAS
jgi:hypothetical protein